ncbi:glycosyltransferase family 4 protein [Pseudonocardia nematodicida]|uniref:Glycosyltransferase family 4 protein n=1 Tax=Pseudonocardia nematodicida TaxID=1206997 RepID=A0ABV1K3T1_9PSEU
MTPAHVLLVHDAYDDYVACLANHLAERTRVTVLHHARIHAGMPLTGDVGTVVYPHRRIRDPRRIASIPRIREVAAEVRADVVHLQQSNDPLFTLVQGPTPGRASVLTVHDVVPHPGDRSHIPGGHLAARRRRGCFDRVVVHADELGADLTRRWGVPRDRIDVVAHGELGSLHGTPRVVDDPPPRVLFFGRIWPYKGLDRLVHAMNALSVTRPGLTLAIAGTGEPLEGYLRLAAPTLRTEVTDRFVDRDEVAPLFADAAVVCLPYLEASQSGVHALACGLGVPVVASAVGGLTSAVAHGRDGLLVPPDDVDALAAALGRVLDEPVLRARLASGARARARTDLSWDTIADRTLEVYDRAAHAHRVAT